MAVEYLEVAIKAAPNNDVVKMFLDLAHHFQNFDPNNSSIEELKSSVRVTRKIEISAPEVVAAKPSPVDIETETTSVETEADVDVTVDADLGEDDLNTVEIPEPEIAEIEQPVESQEPTVEQVEEDLVIESVEPEPVPEPEAEILQEINDLSQNISSSVEPVVEAKVIVEQEQDLVQESTADISDYVSTETQAPLILAVDDSPTIRKLLTMTLESAGFRVMTAENGLDAVKMFSQVTPELVLLDVNMPKMNGYKLCKLIKSHASTKSIPVIMLSGKDGPFNKLKGTMVGCNDYITKPFEAAALVEHVRQYLPEEVLVD
ncbi:response regulator [Planctomicrobium sp.]|nr:response regulator [Planctomicrobium sp.]